MDGASRLTVLVRIVLPLAAPPLGVATFQGAHATEWPLLMAGK